jgi:hypothetical protein
MIQSDFIEITLNRLKNFDFGTTDFSRPALLVKETGITENGGRYQIVTRDTDLKNLSENVQNKVNNAFLQSYNGLAIEDLLLINIKEGEQILDVLKDMEALNPNQYWALCSSIADPSFDGTTGLQSLIDFCMKNDRFYFMAYFNKEAFIETVEAWKELNLTRVFAIYSSQENMNKGIDLALASLLVSNPAGNLTAKFKQLTGFTADNLILDDINSLKEANINVYIKEGSKNSNYSLITEGVTIDGDWFDFVFGLDAMQVDIVNGLRNLFAQDKTIDIGFNSRGYALIKNTILDSLQDYVEREFLSNDIKINITQIDKIPTADFLKRILNLVSIDIKLINKIHKILISLNQSVETDSLEENSDNPQVKSANKKIEIKNKKKGVKNAI